jgi:hypothetical protein
MSSKRPLHPFHLVTPSPWPMFASFAAFIMTVGGVMYMHSYSFGAPTLGFGVVYLVIILSLWVA